MVAGALRTRAAFLVDDDPESALPFVAASAEVAVARGLVETAAWADYLEAEAHFVAGRWDDALAAGLRAIDVGEAHVFHRVVVRSWFVLLPLARARGDADLIRRAFPRFDARRHQETPSPYARIVATAAHLHFAALGLEPAFLPDVEDRLVSFEMDHGGPSWLAAIETIVDAWLGAGELAAARQALDAMRASLERGSPSRLARATEAILRSRQLAAEDPKSAAAEAERALGELAGRAPWWRLQAMRVLEAAGAASDDLLKESAAIERLLGLTAHAVP
jgi:hypothetical protein